MKFKETLLISIVKLKFSFLKKNAYAFWTVIINNWATAETINPTSAAINNNAKLSIIVFILIYLNN